MVSRSIQSAQSQVEAQNFEIRKNVLKYDDVLNRQRQVIYDERRRVLEGEDLEEQVRHFVNDVIDGYVDSATADGYAGDWDLEQLWTALRTLYPVSITIDELAEEAGGRSAISAEQLEEALSSDAHHAYDAARGGPRCGGHARDRAARRHVGARPEVARAPLRDGLPAGGHRAARDGPARPARRVPARGLPALRGDDGRHQGRVRRLHLQRRGPGRSAVRCDRRSGAAADVGQRHGRVPGGHAAGRGRRGRRGRRRSGRGPRRGPGPGPAGSNGTSGSNGSTREPVPTGARVPPAFSAKGLDGPSGARQLRYTAPSDDGSVEERSVREDADGTPGSNGATPSGGNRAPKRSSKKARRRGK